GLGWGRWCRVRHRPDTGRLPRDQLQLAGGLLGQRPGGIVAFILGVWLLPGIRLGRDQDLDLVGVLLASGSLFAVVFGLIEGQRYHWGTFTDTLSFDAADGHWGLFSIPSLFIASVILFILF